MKLLGAMLCFFLFKIIILRVSYPSLYYTILPLRLACMSINWLQPLISEVVDNLGYIIGKTFEIPG